MKAIEYWVLRIADSDATWFGLGWLRPAKHVRIGYWYILFSSILLGLPGVMVGAGLIYLFLGTVAPQVWLWMFLLVLLFELPLHCLFAHYWNRRAKASGNDELVS
jgi:hypothetical protein